MERSEELMSQLACRINVKYTRNRNEREVKWSVVLLKYRCRQFHPQPPVLLVKFDLTGRNTVDVNFDVHPVVDITLYFSNFDGQKSDDDKKPCVDHAIGKDVTFELRQNHGEYQGFLRSVIRTSKVAGPITNLI